ncbi:hypothetical protein GBA52_004067 [Prunus armeniaca]|nr:hypothetical protein GBA52_004067 [Prunus armeniaca]
MHSSGTRTGMSSKPHCSHLPKPDSQIQPLRILVLGCGTSLLSEHLYDVGLKAITNIDLSEIAISDMLCHNACQRPGMKWQVMDITTMQIEDESFDVVVDKGGLDALMEPEFGPKMGNQYLAEVHSLELELPVSKLIKNIGMQINASVQVCFSPTFFGWKMDIHPIPLKLTTKRNNLQTFMVVVARKDQMATAILHQITTSSSLNTTYGNQACRLQLEALENENRIRREYSFTSTGSGIAAISS